MKRILTAIAAAIGIAAGAHARTYDLDDGQGWYDFVFTSACHLKNGDEVKVDFDTGVITNITTGKSYQAQPFPPFIQNIITSGGLMSSIKDRL